MRKKGKRVRSALPVLFLGLALLASAAAFAAGGSLSGLQIFQPPAAATYTETTQAFVENGRLVVVTSFHDGEVMREEYTPSLRPLRKQVSGGDSEPLDWVYVYENDDPFHLNNKLLQIADAASGDLLTSQIFDAEGKPLLERLSYGEGGEAYFAYSYVPGLPAGSEKDFVEIYSGGSAQEALDRQASPATLPESRIFLDPRTMGGPPGAVNVPPTFSVTITDTYRESDHALLRRTRGSSWGLKEEQDYAYNRNKLTRLVSKIDLDVSVPGGWDDTITSVFSYHPSGVLNTITATYGPSGLQRVYQFLWDVPEKYGTLQAVRLVSLNGNPVSPPVEVFAQQEGFISIDELDGILP